MSEDTPNPITTLTDALADDDRVFILPAVMVVVSEEQYRAMIAEQQLNTDEEDAN